MACASNTPTLINLAASFLYTWHAVKIRCRPSWATVSSSASKASGWWSTTTALRHSGIASYMSSGNNSNHSKDVPPFYSPFKSSRLWPAQTKKEKWLRIFPLKGNATSELSKARYSQAATVRVPKSKACCFWCKARLVIARLC